MKGMLDTTKSVATVLQKAKLQNTNLISNFQIDADEIESVETINTLTTAFEIEEEKAEDPYEKGLEAFPNLHYLFPYQRLVIFNIVSSIQARENALTKNTSTERPFVSQDIMESQTETKIHTESQIQSQILPLSDEDYEHFYFPKQIVILPTGAGKSICFQLPGLLMDGISLIIYPLKSLMADQERRILETGMSARVLKGGQTEAERSEIFKLANENKLRLLITNPETAMSPKVLCELKKIVISHMVIDEAHCISEWGDSFRPSYLSLGALVKELNPKALSAFTATASERVIERIKEVLFSKSEVHLVRGDPDRPNIQYFVLKVLSKERSILELAETKLRPLILFCRSRKSTEIYALRLKAYFPSDEIYFYHAGLENEEKKAIEEAFLKSEQGILTATCAYGILHAPYMHI